MRGFLAQSEHEEKPEYPDQKNMQGHILSAFQIARRLSERSASAFATNRARN
jgi:hypothetical protein